MVRWVDPTLQTKVTYRAGDTMICVPPKSGTTWTMNIFHQLKTKGDPDFEDIYAEVPWVEFREGPDQSDEELLERWAKMASPRGFKTHSFPNTQPGGLMQYRDDLKYVVVVRNPEEALVSFKPFLQSFNPKLFDYWQVPELRELLHSFQDFPSFFEKYLLNGLPGMPAEAVPPGGQITMFWIDFINGWWPLRHKKNVLMIHYKDMKADHEGSVRRIGDFLGCSLTEQEWARVFEYTGFDWMKRHQSKFEVRTLLPFPLLREGGMVRKGESGRAGEDGMTPEISARVRGLVDAMVEDEAAREWLYEGGRIPKEKRNNKCAIQ